MISRSLDEVYSKALKVVGEFAGAVPTGILVGAR